MLLPAPPPAAPFDSPSKPEYRSISVDFAEVMPVNAFGGTRVGLTGTLQSSMNRTAAPTGWSGSMPATTAASALIDAVFNHLGLSGNCSEFTVTSPAAIVG
jgi:hypothetical protein